MKLPKDSGLANFVCLDYFKHSISESHLLRNSPAWLSLPLPDVVLLFPLRRSMPISFSRVALERQAAHQRAFWESLIREAPPAPPAGFPGLCYPAVTGQEQALRNSRDLSVAERRWMWGGCCPPRWELEGCSSPEASSPHLCPHKRVPHFSLVFTNKPKAPVVIYSRCCLRHLPGEFDPAMFLTYFCTYLDHMFRPPKLSLY